MLALIIAAIYPAAAYVLYRLWSSDHRIIWWTVLISVVLMILTRETIKNAIAQTVRDLADELGIEDRQAVAQAGPWIGNDVVRFWTQANIVVTLVALAATVAGLFVPATASESSKPPLPRAVELFFEVYGGTQAAMADLQESAPTDAKGAIRKSEARLKEVLSKARRVDTDLLDQIYPAWGSHFASDLVPGIELLHKAASQSDSSYARAASAHLRQWDNWLGSNWSNVLSRLHEQYEVDIR